MPISTLVDSVMKVAPLVINHQGQFPSVTISFNLAPGAAIGDAVSAIQRVEKELGAPLYRSRGNAQAFGASLKSTPILGEIHATPHIPSDIAVASLAGKCGRNPLIRLTC